jgi:hypothetical protein
LPNFRQKIGIFWIPNGMYDHLFLHKWM